MLKESRVLDIIVINKFDKSYMKLNKIWRNTGYAVYFSGEYPAIFLVKYNHNFIRILNHEILHHILFDIVSDDVCHKLDNIDNDMSSIIEKFSINLLSTDLSTEEQVQKGYCVCGKSHKRKDTYYYHNYEFVGKKSIT